jgi:hypothetical protein
MTISIGEAPAKKDRGTARFSDLIDTALENRGQWVSTEVPEDTTVANRPGIYSLVHNRASRMLGVDVSVRDGKVFVLIADDE